MVIILNIFIQESCGTAVATTEPAVPIPILFDQLKFKAEPK